MCVIKYETDNGIRNIKRKEFRKIVVPMSSRNKLLNIGHESVSHPGIKKRLK